MMSVVNVINTGNQAGQDLISENSENASRVNQEVERVEKVSLSEQMAKAEETKKAQEKNAEETVVMTPNQLEKVAQQLQDFMGEMNRSLEFLVDKDSGRDVIKVLDKGTGELVKQYPSEEVLTLISKLSDATGNLIDTEI
jgi:flagellar protein FlaG